MHSKKNKLKTAIIILIFILILAVAVFAIFKYKNSKSKSDTTYSLSTVTRGDVEKTITGSGSVEPYERYEIIPLVNGEITSSPYEVGDYVEKDSIIYTFDMSDAVIDYEKQTNSMEKSTLSYTESMKDKEKLTIKSPSSGRVKSVSVSKGDEVSSNQVIATISDDLNLSVKIPFTKEQIHNISIGSTANLSSSTQMSNFTGKVSFIDNTPSAYTDGSSVYFVTVEFKNPGAIEEGTNLGCEINGEISPGYATVKYGEEKQIKVEAKGVVKSLNISEGAYISKGDNVATLTSDEIDTSIKKSKLDYDDAKLSLQSQQEKLENYELKAPISGTVLTKNSKKGDTIDKTNSSVTMMVIGDVSKLKFSLSIDELDVAEVEIGQKVKITSDAVEDAEFEGEITNISMEGTASNGVTTYEAVVIINDPGELKPSMNVDAVVVIESKSNVLRVPSSDVKTAMGHSYVFVKDTNTNSSTKKSSNNKEAAPSDAENISVPGSGDDTSSSEGDSTRHQRPNGTHSTDGERPSFDGEKPSNTNGTSSTGERPTFDGKPSNAPQSDNSKYSPERKSTSDNNIGENSNGFTPPESDGDSDNENQIPTKSNKLDNIKLPEAPEGFITVEVIIGLEGDDYTEIISGLEEGQQIYKQEVSSSSSSNMFGMPGGMGGGMPGGMGGGMPGGNMGGSRSGSSSSGSRSGSGMGPR